ncbi:MAG: methylmalonyl-CoA mutase [Rhodothermia bacterium]
MNRQRRTIVRTSSGIEIKPVYRAADAPTDPGELPGEQPFTRGIYPDMYRSRIWTMRQYAGFSTAEESNSRYKYLLSQGVKGLSVAFDLPTQIGYDSDHPIADGEVGRVGVAIDTLDDMKRLFAGIDLESVTTSMTINSTAAIILAFYIVAAEDGGARAARLGWTVQNDILKEYAARGTHIYPPGPSMRLVTDIVEWCSHEVPKWNTISISGYHMREAGATAAQELGLTLANGIAYVQAAVDRGLEVDDFGARLSFFFNAHNEFFEEIAKFRAARRLWAGIMKDRFGATNPRAMQCRFHTQTGGSTLTAQQPENNVARVTIQSLAAVLGGTQSLHTNGADEALSLPSVGAARTALRTQQIIAYESGITATADPLAGSYYVEALTSDLESRARSIIEKIDALGGAVAAIESGYYQNEIGRSAYEYQLAVERGDRLVVGVNSFTEDEQTQRPIFRPNEKAAVDQIERVAEFRRNRNDELFQSALTSLRRRANEGGNLQPTIVEAVRARCTLGEIASALRDVWGEYS